MSVRPLTSSQTVGPFFHDCLFRADARRTVLCDASVEGARIRVEGRVTDGDGAPVPDAMLEIWQANAHGRYNHAADQRDAPLDVSFSGFGRVDTDDDGRFAFTTVKPGVVPFDADRGQAPHLSIVVLGRGLNNHLYTRVYFDDEAANATDPVLAHVPAERRATLIARRVGNAGVGESAYRFNVVLQGANETVFFDFRTPGRS